ncbi:group I truncated hemoglobin [Euryhalocaulis caribicus]|uniref:group I truncated hemoglobin n=1 Tax=Euryhalocaulis caribicus TaxID=1161401 RepID=UPI001F52170E|nr:group 1 truncated hemoglobin [Euryhalocaulis caribicus]
MTALAALLLAAGAAQAADATLYEDLGGADAVERIAHGAIDRSVADPRIGHTFENSNVDRVKRLLTEQICDLTGGPCEYSGQTMEASHKGLALDTADFNALVENLQDAMDEEGVGFRTQNRLLAILAPMHRDVVTE